MGEEQHEPELDYCQECDQLVPVEMLGRNFGSCNDCYEQAIRDKHRDEAEQDYADSQGYEGPGPHPVDWDKENSEEMQAQEAETIATECTQCQEDYNDDPPIGGDVPF